MGASATNEPQDDASPTGLSDEELLISGLWLGQPYLSNDTRAVHRRA